jgi:hypothetical protein
MSKVKNYYTDDDGNMPEVDKILDNDPAYQQWLDELEEESERDFNKTKRPVPSDFD